MPILGLLRLVNSDPWTSLDGRLNAPVGTAQYPSLLNGYPSASPPGARVRWPSSGTQPPWMVAGVDYYVGAQSAGLTDIRVSQPAGTLLAANTLTINADNVTISGYDFTSGNGVAITCPSHSNLTINNCHLGGSNYTSLSTGPIDFRGSNLTITNCTIDGGSIGGSEAQSTLISCNPTAGGGDTGNLILKYNWLKNYCQHVLELLNSVSGLDYRFNFIDDTQIGTAAHMNWLQLGSGTITSPVVSFNAQRQTLLGGAEGFQFYFNGTGTLTSPTLSNNTLICRLNGGTQTMSNVVHGGAPAGGGSNSNNYFDSSGAFASYYPGSMAGWSSAGNINMNDGSPIIPG